MVRLEVRSRVKYVVRGDKLFLEGVIDGELRAVPAPKKPYAFALASGDIVSKLIKLGALVEETDLRDEFGRKVVKYEVVGSPRRVAEIRDRVGYDVTYEADVPFIRRLLTDRDLVVKYGDAVAYVDIEVDDSAGFPREYGQYRILSIAFSGGGKVEWLYYRDAGEEEMLREFVGWMKRNKKTVIAAWNTQFDYQHLLERCRVLGLKDEWRWLRYCNTLDLYASYKSEVKGLSGYTLLEVAEHEGMDTAVKARTKKVSEMTRGELMEYNTNDVALIAEIDRRYGFTAVELEIAELVNLTLDLTIDEEREYRRRAVVIGDTLILRRARELGYVLRNGRREKKKGYSGALIFQPKRYGLIENVAVFDTESMYPNIVVNERIDVGEFKGEVLPEIERELLDLRKQYKALYKVTGIEAYDVRQKALKVLANALYGLLGTKGFRYFDERKAALVTRKGRELLMRIAEVVSSVGAEVIYGDTDSVFIRLSDLSEETIKSVESLINERIKPYRVKFEYAGKVLFLPKSGSNEAAKKRYVMRTVDGEWVVRGVELRRSDWNALTKEVVWRVVEMVFEGRSKDEVIAYLADVRRRMLAGEYDRKLIMSKSYNPKKEYKVNQEHVRAARKLEERGVPVFDRVLYVYVGSDVEPLVDVGEVEKFRGKLNYSKYWDKLMGAVRRVLKAAYGGGSGGGLDSFFRAKRKNRGG